MAPAVRPASSVPHGRWETSNAGRNLGIPLDVFQRLLRNFPKLTPKFNGTMDNLYIYHKYSHKFIFHFLFNVQMGREGEKGAPAVSTKSE